MCAYIVIKLEHLRKKERERGKMLIEVKRMRCVKKENESEITMDGLD